LFEAALLQGETILLTLEKAAHILYVNF